MKRFLSLLVALVLIIPLASKGQGGLGPTPILSGGGSAGILQQFGTTNTASALSNIIQTLTVNPTNGLTATQIAVQIAASNLVTQAQIATNYIGYQQFTNVPITSVLRLPRVGSMRGATFRDTIGSGVGASSAKAMMYLNAGYSGVVRNVKFAGAEGGDTGSDKLTNLTFKVFCDAGDIADLDNPPAANLTFSAPVNMLLNKVWRTTSAVRGTRYLDTQDRANGQSGVIGFNLKLPMPFTNGICIQMYSGATNVTHKFSSISFDLGANPGAYPYGYLRCRSYYTNCTNSFAYQSDVAANSARIFLSTSNSPGFLVGVLYANRGTTNAVQWEEGNWQFQSETAPTSYDGSFLVSEVGGEDLFNNSYYFSNGQNANYDYGTVWVTTAVVSGVTYTDQMEGYRWYDRDILEWTNHFVGFKDIYSGTTNMEERFLSIYYSR